MNYWGVFSDRSHVSVKTHSVWKLLCFVKCQQYQHEAEPLVCLLCCQQPVSQPPRCWQDFDFVPPFRAKHSAGCTIVYFLWVFYRNITSLWLTGCTTDCSTGWLVGSLGVCSASLPTGSETVCVKNSGRGRCVCVCVRLIICVKVCIRVWLCCGWMLSHYSGNLKRPNTKCWTIKFIQL